MPARQPTCQAFQLRRTSNSWIHTIRCVLTTKPKFLYNKGVCVTIYHATSTNVV